MDAILEMMCNLLCVIGCEFNKANQMLCSKNGFRIAMRNFEFRNKVRNVTLRSYIEKLPEIDCINHINTNVKIFHLLVIVTIFSHIIIFLICRVNNCSIRRKNMKYNMILCSFIRH